MKIIPNIYQRIDELIIYEKSQGVLFNEKGLPIFTRADFSLSVPKIILPYRHRNSCLDKKETAICFFEPDEALYRRLPKGKLESTADKLLKYEAFVGFDLSIFTNFAYAFQEFYVLANLVIDKYFILRGNKMIPNLRVDKKGIDGYFELFREAPVACCGTLGCASTKRLKHKNRELIQQYVETHPDQLLIQYGSKVFVAAKTSAVKPFGRK